jgi:hypothetical protein
MSQATDLHQHAELCFTQYVAAWAARDPDAIAALHTLDSVFAVPALGLEAVGRDAVRAAIEGVFTLWPDLVFHERRSYVSPELWVLESVMEGTLAVPLTVGGVTIRPNGGPATIDLCDVFRVEHGLVRRKDSYVDVLGYQQLLAGR